MIARDTRARARLSLLLFAIASPAALFLATPAHSHAAAEPVPVTNFRALIENTASAPPASLSAVGTPDDTGTTPLTNSQIQEILDQHNTYRTRHGSPALEWSDALTYDAENALMNCHPFSSPSRYGRNEYTSVETDFYLAVKIWYDQISGYNFQDPAQSNRNSGTFSQVVWKSSKRIGCAVKECASEEEESDSGESSFVHVCVYDPPGNIVTRLYSLYKKNVLPATARNA
ncbi:MAG: CAP domain-containing protein [Linnemannia gamsii]|nr:MAG: CAP domain-containing protein [Linnemannia gamsii]